MSDRSELAQPEVDLNDEVESTSKLITAASAAEERLSVGEIDAALGLPA
jgi:hypothetical protein